jgi:hypothetical protein
VYLISVNSKLLLQNSKHHVDSCTESDSIKQFWKLGDIFKIQELWLTFYEPFEILSPNFLRTLSPWKLLIQSNTFSFLLIVAARYCLCLTIWVESVDLWLPVLWGRGAPSLVVSSIGTWGSSAKAILTLLATYQKVWDLSTPVTWLGDKTSLGLVPSSLKQTKESSPVLPNGR